MRRPQGTARSIAPPGAHGSQKPAIGDDAIARIAPPLGYIWMMAEDAVQWSDATGPLAALAADAAGGALDARIEGPGRGDRIRAIGGVDEGLGVPYALRYTLRLSQGQLATVDDKGRWFAGEDGAPRLAQGTLTLLAIGADGLPETDRLTGALHRNALSRELATALEQAEAARRGTGLLLLSMRNLRSANLRHGEGIADGMIAAVAALIAGSMRRGDRLFRYSGSKFALLLNDCSEEEIETAALRFHTAVCAEPLRTAEGHVGVDLRVGGALAPLDGREATALLAAAEQALRDACEVGSPAFVRYEPDRERDAERRRDLEATDRILSGLNDRRIVLAYQPIARASDRRIASYEGLVRLRLPDGRIVGADQLVPAAERIGLLKMIDHRVVSLAVARLAQDPALRLSINVAVPNALDHAWYDGLAAVLGANRACAARLTVEITETAIIRDLDAAARVVKALHGLGVKVAIDDFGSGHTSFKALRALPVDIVKIDGVFVRDVAEDPSDRFFVKTLVDLAKHLGMAVTAEWVRTEAAAAILTDLGVDYLQGEAIGAPEIELISVNEMRRIER